MLHTSPLPPGAHDAVTHELTLGRPDSADCDSNLPLVANGAVRALAKAQTLTLSQQLYAGVRYFDLRIRWYQGKM